MNKLWSSLTERGVHATAVTTTRTLPKSIRKVEILSCLLFIISSFDLIYEIPNKRKPVFQNDKIYKKKLLS